MKQRRFRTYSYETKQRNKARPFDSLNFGFASRIIVSVSISVALVRNHVKIYNFLHQSCSSRSSLKLILLCLMKILNGSIFKSNILKNTTKCHWLRLPPFLLTATYLESSSPCSFSIGVPIKNSRFVKPSTPIHYFNVAASVWQLGELEHLPVPRFIFRTGNAVGMARNLNICKSGPRVRVSQ